MEFKREYLSPEIQVVEPITTYSVMVEASDGVLGDYDSKKTDIVEEEETGIPDNFSNIWGDEEED